MKNPPGHPLKIKKGGGFKMLQNIDPSRRDKRITGNARESAFRGKIILGRAAYGADPVLGEFFERSPGFNAAFRIPDSRVVDITTNIAGVLFHLFLSFSFFSGLPGRRKKLKSGFSSSTFEPIRMNRDWVQKANRRCECLTQDPGAPSLTCPGPYKYCSEYFPGCHEFFRRFPRQFLPSPWVSGENDWRFSAGGGYLKSLGGRAEKKMSP